MLSRTVSSGSDFIIVILVITTFEDRDPSVNQRGLFENWLCFGVYSPERGNKEGACGGLRAHTSNTVTKAVDKAAGNVRS